MRQKASVVAARKRNKAIKAVPEVEKCMFDSMMVVGGVLHAGRVLKNLRKVE